jgi:hypothetical protein
VPKGSRNFSGLLSDPPRPLPDDDDATTAAAEVPAVEEAPPADIVDLRKPAVPESAAEATPRAEEVTTAAGRQRPARQASAPSAPVPAAAPASGGDAAATVRLHQPAANALNDAWLDQRMHVNPKLSKPEFASEIVRLGLAAFERRNKKQP